MVGAPQSVTFRISEPGRYVEEFLDELPLHVGVPLNRIDGAPRFATCVAAESSLIAVLDRESLTPILEDLVTRSALPLLMWLATCRLSPSRRW